MFEVTNSFGEASIIVKTPNECPFRENNNCKVTRKDTINMNCDNPFARPDDCILRKGKVTVR